MEADGPPPRRDEHSGHLADTQLYAEYRQVADEQAALRRVATAVARAAPPEEVFAAVIAEAGGVLGVDRAFLVRYDNSGTLEVVGTWAITGEAAASPPGTRLPLGGRNVTTLVWQTAAPARIEYDEAISGAIGRVAARDEGLASSVGVPVSVEGELWGAVVVAFTGGELLPADTESRLAGFTELLGTAIANAQARTELQSSAEEQAALRRVATLVARATSPEQVFAAVTEEAGRLLAADVAVLNRYIPDTAETVAAWASNGIPPVTVGACLPVGGQDVSSQVFETGQPARIDSYDGVTGLAGDRARAGDVRASVGVPVSVAGELWGVMIVASRSDPLPADTQARLAGFTELAATAVANGEARAELTGSRARIVAAADQARRRIERDLHDGAQQRLVSLALQLRAAQAEAPPEAGELAMRLEGAVAEVNSALEELREIARGLHPAALAEGGLRPALRALARRSTVPVSLQIRVPVRLPEQVEVSAYYVVAEALTNAARHGRASAAAVEAEVVGDALHVTVRDDGTGGADFAGGTGLAGLKDRVEALGGRIALDSPRGAGTSLRVQLPVV